MAAVLEPELDVRLPDRYEVVDGEIVELPPQKRFRIRNRQYCAGWSRAACRLTTCWRNWTAERTAHEFEQFVLPIGVFATRS